MDSCSIPSDLTPYLCDTILEARLDPRNMNSLFSALWTNSGYFKNGAFVIMQQDKIILGSLPSITLKMVKILQNGGSCLSEDSKESLLSTFKEKRKVFIVSLFGKFVLITEADLLSLLTNKISRDLEKRKVIKRGIDFDIFVSLLICNFNNKDDCRSNSRDDISSVDKTNTEIYENKNISVDKTNKEIYENKNISVDERNTEIHENKNISVDERNTEMYENKSISGEERSKNVTNNKRLYRTHITHLSFVPARKYHETTLITYEIEAYPNDSHKYDKKVNYRDSPSNSENLPIQVTEIDGGQLSFEPSFGAGSSRRLDSSYSEQPSTNTCPPQEISRERRNFATSGTGIRNTVKRPRYPDYVEQQQRLESFCTPKWTANTKPDINLLADCGFFFTGNQDLVRCHQCGIGLKDWIKDDDVLNEHVKHSSSCDFLVQKLGQTDINRMNIALSSPGSADSNIERDATSSNAVQLPYKIRSPRYQTMEARVASFQSFPQHIMISPQALAVSGLFYTGNGDLCRCFTCDGGLKDWSSGDDPVKEHAKYFSHCSYINQLKGQDYVQTQQQSRSSNEVMGATGGNSTVTRPTETSSSIPIDRLTIADPGYSSFHVSQVVQQCGYDEVDVITAKTELERKGNRFPTAQDIVNTILDMQESNANSEGSTGPRGSENDVQTLVEENERLSRQVYCKLCIDKEADILFLPCTHHRICHECAQNVSLCPVCNTLIKEKVKTFRS